MSRVSNENTGVILMFRRNCSIATLLVFFLFLQGCAGVRNSYESLLEADVVASSDEPFLEPGADMRLIILGVGEKREVLAISNGFPGWWGYYPAIASFDPEVASVVCEKGRSLIPFRKPGIVFGGERCYIQTHKIGSTLLVPMSQYLLRYSSETDSYELSSDVGFPGDWITLDVVAASDN